MLNQATPISQALNARFPTIVQRPVVRLKQEPEGYCSVLDILVSLMTPALDVEFGEVLFSERVRLNWHQKISRSCPRQPCRCRIDGPLLAVELRFQPRGILQ